MFSFVKILLIRPLKSLKKFTQPQISTKNKYPSVTLGRKLTKGYHSVVTPILTTSVTWVMITACAIFCSLKFHVFCTSVHFGDSIFPHDKSENDQDIDSGWFTYSISLTYDCWHCFLVFNIWVRHALEMTIILYYPILELFCFSNTQPFTETYSKFCLPNPFLFGATPRHN
jgi:hypothetical protein